MGKQILKNISNCPLCGNPIIHIVDGKCPSCVKPLKAEWIGKKTFKSFTNNHKSKLKLIVNPILRKIQFWTKEPYVIVSIVERIGVKNINVGMVEVTYVFYKYQFKPTRYFKTIAERDRHYANLLLEEKKEEK